ncbi:hypothetical protein E2C01_034705 [Portunus trituberculatus]|uniref:Uncharacterized protein n=1 Tax=Portunus trituberculatus TaxID=210409 RepID=A0A5B7F285_PORTR|nr:hypothetical protein [Portunus trituberculatus]
MAIMQFCDLFPDHRATALTIMSGTYAASAALFLVFQQSDQSPHEWHSTSRAGQRVLGCRLTPQKKHSRPKDVAAQVWWSRAVVSVEEAVKLGGAAGSGGSCGSDSMKFSKVQIQCVHSAAPAPSKPSKRSGRISFSMSNRS